MNASPSQNQESPVKAGTFVPSRQFCLLRSETERKGVDKRLLFPFETNVALFCTALAILLVALPLFLFNFNVQ